jgi:hypothetical protein
VFPLLLAYVCCLYTIFWLVIFVILGAYPKFPTACTCLMTYIQISGACGASIRTFQSCWLTADQKKTATSWAPQGATGSKLRSALCHPEAPRRVRFRWHFASRSPQDGLYETDLSITLVSKSSVCSFYDSLTSFHNLPSVSSLSALAFTGISSISQFPPGQIHWIFPRR